MNGLVDSLAKGIVGNIVGQEQIAKSRAAAVSATMDVGVGIMTID